VDERIVEKLRKVLALADSPIEGEAQAAAGHLARLLTKYNLNIADLEKRGGRAAPGVKDKGLDLGKAAFKWKLDLADGMAEFYYCHPIVNRYTKTVLFVGRPDNVESMVMLYAWVVEQIKKIAKEERRKHYDSTGEHIDPLRWQVSFGQGCVGRLIERLHEMRARQEEDEAETRAGEETTAMVLHHKSEISDWLESKGMRRTDGRETKREREYRERREADDARLELLKVTDLEAYYLECPWDRPETEEQKAARAKREEEWLKKEAARERRRRAYIPTGGYREKRTDWGKEEQAGTAATAGRKSGDRVNLRPFIGPGKVPKGAIK